MARTSVNIAIALIFINAAAGFLVTTGVAGDWGISPEVGGDEEIQDIEETSQQVETNSGTGDTLLGLYDAVTGAFSSLIKIVFAGPAMLNNLGVPSAITTLFFAPLYLIVAGDTIYMLSQRVLV